MLVNTIPFIVCPSTALRKSATCSGDAIHANIVHREGCVKDGTATCDPVQGGPTMLFQTRDSTQPDLLFAYDTFPTAPILLLRQLVENTARGTLIGGMIIFANGIFYGLGSNYKVTPGEGTSPMTVTMFAD
jgi:hypothetical protein